MQTQRQNGILFLSLPLALAIIITSSTGLFTIDFYIKESFNWQVQSVGQDMIDLFLIVPVLIISAIIARNGNKIALLLWGGTNLYLVYTYTLFCFDVHFNSLFIFYCFNLGLSFYSLMYFMYMQIRSPLTDFPENKRMIRAIGYYFILMVSVFYGLWLAEIIPAIHHHVLPASLIDAGLPTNGVHVLDLSIFLPGLLLTGILLLKKKKMGLMLAPVFLLFFILMDITIGGLIMFMYQKGLEVQLVVSFLMTGLALISSLLLFWYCFEMIKNNNLTYL